MFSQTEFFPTPKPVIDKMISKMDKRKIVSILEPSSGAGDILDELCRQIDAYNYRSGNTKRILDSIEINDNLKHILKGKGYRVIHDDFLTFNSYKHYSHIVMNPPFSSGDKHLLKAIEIMETHGGQIICLLNSQTLKNAHSNYRKVLCDKLELYKADIEILENAFSDAERKTDVEIALIEIKIPAKTKESDILKNLKRESEFNAAEKDPESLINGDFIQGIIERYNHEVKAGTKLISEYEALRPHMLTSFGDDAKSCILDISVSGSEKYSSCMYNDYIKLVRNKYWQTLFNSSKFSDMFTEKSRSEYMSKLDELVDYDFTQYNIDQLQIEIINSMKTTIEDTIIDLFDDFSSRHHYSEYSKNIHLFNGWKTNEAWKINKKVIIPLSAFNRWDSRLDLCYSVKYKLRDIEKVFSYFDAININDKSLHEALDQAQRNGITKNIDLKYFKVTFYKKGTCHIEFKDMELLKKFNLFGSQKKNWLPPSYGHAKYENMSAEEKSIVDEFEGKESYEKSLSSDSLLNYSRLLMIA